MNKWVKQRIKNVCDVVAGVSFPIKYQGAKDYNIPFYKVSDMNLLINSKLMRDSINSVDNEILNKLKAKTYPQGTVIFPKVGAALLTNKRRILSKDSVFDNNIMGLIPKAIDSNFLYYWSLTVDFKKYAGSGAVPSINQRFVESLELPIPEPAIQIKIATILSTIDKTLEKTDQIIQKIELLKKGLMQELLTKGVGHKKFKFTEVGEIPEDWKIFNLEVVANVIDPHPSHRAPKEDPLGLPFIGIGDIDQEGQIDLAKSRKISLEDVQKQNSEVPLEDFDIAFSRVASVGKVVWLRKQNFPYAVSPTFAVIKPKGIERQFLFYILQSNFMLEQINKLTTGSTRVSLGIQLLRKLKIVMPTLAEQQIVGDILSTVDKKINSNKKSKENLLVLKKGLMQDIFNQKVEIN